MGTRFEIVIDADDVTHARAASDASIDVIREWHDALSVFEPSSLVSFLNAHAARRAVSVDLETLELFRTAQRVSAASDGAFNPAIAPEMQRLHPAAHAYEHGEAQRVRRRGSMRDIEIDPIASTIGFRDPQLAVDFGAIGKGHALACVRDQLRSDGIESAFIQGGTSSAVAFGTRTARIVLPDTSVVTLRDAAFSLSMVDGPQAGHVLDPRTGDAASAALWCVIVTDCPRQADAWSTALLVLGAPPASMDATATGFIGQPDGTVNSFGPRVDVRRLASSSLAS